MGNALSAAFQVQRDFPQQKVGTGNGITTSTGSNRFLVVRNKDSYTVKDG